MKQLIHSITITFLALVVSLLHEQISQASFLIYGVKSDFPMTEGQKLHRDVFVNMGSSQGLKEGTKLDVYRVMSTADQMNQRNGPNIRFRVASMKIIHVEEEMCVARVTEFSSIEGMPNPEFMDVIVGDIVEVSRK